MKNFMTNKKMHMKDSGGWKWLFALAIPAFFLGKAARKRFK